MAYERAEARRIFGQDRGEQTTAAKLLRIFPLESDVYICALDHLDANGSVAYVLLRIDRSGQMNSGCAIIITDCCRDRGQVGLGYFHVQEWLIGAHKPLIGDSRSA